MTAKKKTETEARQARLAKVREQAKELKRKEDADRAKAAETKDTYMGGHGRERREELTRMYMTLKTDAWEANLDIEKAQQWRTAISHLEAAAKTLIEHYDIGKHHRGTAHLLQAIEAYTEPTDDYYDDENEE